MANILPTIHLLAPVRLVMGLLIPARLVVLDMVDFIFYGVGGCEITTYYFLLGWLPSVSGCTPFKLCGGGEGPVGVDNLFTMRSEGHGYCTTTTNWRFFH